MKTTVEFYDLPMVTVDLEGDLQIGIPGPKGDKGDKGDRGDMGLRGPKGEQGEEGKPGADGATFTPVLGENGVLNWENDQGKPNPDGVDLKALMKTASGEELDAIRKDIAYLELGPIEITGVSNNKSKMEQGSKVTEVTVSWTLNRDPVSQKLHYYKNADTKLEMEVDAAVRSVTLTDLNLKKVTRFAVEAVDERGGVASYPTYIRFYNGIYYGVLPYGGAIDSGAILGMTRVLQNERTVNFTVSPGAGERPAYALPSGSGTPTFKIGSFEYEWEKVATFEFTNASGYAEEYDVWMHGQNVTGSITVNVT